MTETNVDPYFAAINALVRTGGVVIVTTPNNEDIEAAKVFCPESAAMFHPMQHVRSFDAVGLAAFMSKYGFAPLEVFATDFGVSLRTPRRWVADKAKRLLGMGTQPLHLAVVARKLAAA